MNTSIKTFVLIFCFFGLGCQEIDQVKKPEVLLSESKMEEILYESTLLKAARGYNAGKMSQTGIKPETYIFNKFNIDSTSLAQNMAYYATKTDAFREMNQRILKKLETLYAVKDSIYSIERKERDSLNKLNQKNRKLSILDTTKPVIRKKPSLDKMILSPNKRAKELMIRRDSV